MSKISLNLIIKNKLYKDNFKNIIIYMKQKKIVVLPAYNASKTLEKTIKDIDKNLVDEIILVDDKSDDNTIQIAKKLGISFYKHKKNKGYGGNQKTCYQIALKRGADIVIMLHPDYQYDPKLIPHFINLLNDDYFDVMLGSRIRSRKEVIKSGMPKYKYFSNRFLSFIENLATGHNLSEWHTGMRAYRKKVLEKINFNKFSNDFIFDTQMLFAIIQNNFKIGEISIPVKYQKDSSNINFKKGLKYGLQTLFIALKYIFKKKGPKND